MKTKQSPDKSPLHQTVAGEVEFKAGTKSIAVGFTDQQLSAHAGSAVFWAWLHASSWKANLAEYLVEVVRGPPLEPRNVRPSKRRVLENRAWARVVFSRNF